MTRILRSLDTGLVFPPQRGGRRLARGERFLRTPGTRQAFLEPALKGRRTHTGASVRQFLRPLPGCVRCFYFYPVDRKKRSPPANLFPPFQGGRAIGRLEIYR